MLQVKNRLRVSAAGAVGGCEELVLALGFGDALTGRAGCLQNRRKTEKLRRISERGSLKLKAGCLLLSSLSSFSNV